MMLSGLFFMIFGGRFFKITMFISGQLSVAAIIMIVMFAFVYPNNSPMWVVGLTLIVSIGMGSGIGYAAFKWSRIGVLIIGCWVGGLFGAILYTLFFHLFSKE